MRVIKFRAWDGKKMWSSVGFTDSDVGRLVKQETYMIGGGDTVGYTSSVELMQYTGLKDKNGVEVYEGDIVNCSSGCPHQMVWMIEAPSRNIGGMPGFYLSGLNEGYVWMGMEEVIGNVHENPELLEGTK